MNRMERIEAALQRAKDSEGEAEEALRDAEIARRNAKLAYEAAECD